MPEICGNIEVYALIEDETKRPATLSMVQMLREEGWSVDYPLAPMKPDKQIKRALEVRAEFTVRIEDDEFAVLNYFETKQEEKVPFGELEDRMIQIICADDSE